MGWLVEKGDVLGWTPSMVEFDTNATLFASLKNRTDTNMQPGYITLLNRIRATAIIPQCHILDNKCSESMKKII